MSQVVYKEKEMEKKTLTIVLSSLGGGGAERVAVELAEYFCNGTHKVHLITLSGAESDVYSVPKGVERRSLNLYSQSTGPIDAFLNNIRRVWVLRNALKETNPTIVLSFLVETNVTTLLAMVGLKCPAVISERNYAPLEDTPSYWKFLRKRVYPLAASVVVQTQKSADWLESNIPVKNMAVIPNYARWPMPSERPSVDVHSIVGHCPFVFAVGRLHPQKGFDRLIEQFAMLSPGHEEWMCVIAGDDVNSNYGKKLEEQIKKLKLEKRIKLIGRVGNLEQWYSRCGLFVLSSRYEGFPNVLLEAMAHGAAAVSVDCDTGPADIIQHGVNGMLVSADHENELVETIETLICSPEKRQLLGEEAMKVRAKFSKKKVTSQWESVLGSMLQ